MICLNQFVGCPTHLCENCVNAFATTCVTAHYWFYFRFNGDPRTFIPVHVCGERFNKIYRLCDDDSFGILGLALRIGWLDSALSFKKEVSGNRLNGLYELLDWASLARLTRLSRDTISMSDLRFILARYRAELDCWTGREVGEGEWSKHRCRICLADSMFCQLACACMFCNRMNVCRDCEIVITDGNHAAQVQALGATRWHTTAGRRYVVRVRKGDRVCGRCTLAGASPRLLAHARASYVVGAIMDGLAAART